MSVFYQIAKNTFRESLREPIYLLLLLSALAVIGIFPVFTMFAFREQIKLVVDSAMATTMVMGWLVAVLTASHAISREIENGTALLLLSKPVERPVFILAKIAGVLLALTVFSVLCSIAAVVSVRVAKDQFQLDNTVMAVYFGVLALGVLVGGVHNYVTRSSFPMAAVTALLVLFPVMAAVVAIIPVAGERVGLSTETVPALVLILFSVWAMGSLATALSTRFSLVSNLLLCMTLFIVGLMSDFVLGRHAREAWSDTVPRGTAPLWMSSYTFAPTETLPVGRWSRPEPVDDGRVFTVWTAAGTPAPLSPLGSQPEAAWRDVGGWVDDVRDLAGAAVHMARYDAATGQWDIRRIAGERGQVRADAADRSFTAISFRRSVHRPRTPVGGTHASPSPHPGSRLASVVYACVPNWQLFWMADALAAKQSIPLSYVVIAGLYAVLVVGFFVLLAVALFSQREVGTQALT